MRSCSKCFWTHVLNVSLDTVGGSWSSRWEPTQAQEEHSHTERPQAWDQGQESLLRGDGANHCTTVPPPSVHFILNEACDPDIFCQHHAPSTAVKVLTLTTCRIKCFWCDAIFASWVSIRLLRCEYAGWNKHTLGVSVRSIATVLNQWHCFKGLHDSLDVKKKQPGLKVPMSEETGQEAVINIYFSVGFVSSTAALPRNCPSQ